MSTVSTSSGFRLLVNLEDFFTDLKKKAYVYVDLNKISTIEDLKLKITKLFQIHSPIDLLCNNSIVLDQEDVRVFRDDDEVKVITSKEIPSAYTDTVSSCYNCLKHESTQASQRYCSSVKYYMDPFEEVVDGYLKNTYENRNTEDYDKKQVLEPTEQHERRRHKRKIQDENPPEIDMSDMVREIEEVKTKKKKSKYKKYSVAEGIKYLMNNDDTVKEPEPISHEDVTEIAEDDCNGCVDVEFSDIVEKKKRKRKRKHKKRKESDHGPTNNTSTISWNNISFPPPSGKHTYIEDDTVVEDVSSNSIENDVEGENMLDETSEICERIFGESNKLEFGKKQKENRRNKETDIELDSLYESLKGLPIVPVYEYKIPRTQKNSQIQKGEIIEVRCIKPEEGRDKNIITNKSTGISLGENIKKFSNGDSMKETVKEKEFLELLCGEQDDYSKAKEIIKSFEVLKDPSDHINHWIVFMILKMTDDYNPELSDIICGRILDYDFTNKQIKFQIYFGREELKQPVGKFSLEEEEMNDQYDIYELNWCEIINARVVSY